MLPNRESGNWLPQVESCPVRAKPCGNPLDADQAMRAGQIQAAGRGDYFPISLRSKLLKMRVVSPISVASRAANVLLKNTLAVTG